MIADPHQAEAVIAEGRADWVALARGFLDDPRWAGTLPTRSAPRPPVRRSTSARARSCGRGPRSRIRTGQDRRAPLPDGLLDGAQEVRGHHVAVALQLRRELRRRTTG